MSDQSSPFLQTLTMERDVCLTPQCFNSKIVENVLAVLVKQFTDLCDETTGILISIQKIRSMTNRVSKNSMHAEFTVVFDALVAKPIMDTDFKFQVEQVTKTGVFGTIAKKMKIYIPNRMLEGWDFCPDETNSEKNCFVKNQSRIGVGSWLISQIQHCKFVSDVFGCRCCLVKICE